MSSNFDQLRKPFWGLGPMVILPEVYFAYKCNTLGLVTLFWRTFPCVDFIQFTMGGGGVRWGEDT